MIAAFALDSSQFVREVVIPLGLAYAGLMLAILIYGAELRLGRTSAREPHEGQGDPVSARRTLIVTVTGGYAVFLGITLGYYAFVAKQTSSFVFQAITGGAFMAFAIVLHGFVLFSWIEEVFLPWVRRRSRGSDRPTGHASRSSAADRDRPGVLGAEEPSS